MRISRKYPRTLHLPQSLSVTSDDKVHKGTEQFIGREVVITEKMDGENTTIHSEGTHARSVDSKHHPSRDWLKGYAASISPQLDPCERICGEYMYARHSIAYSTLPSYFMGFGWFVDDELQSWSDTIQRFEQLEIIPVPTLYHGPFHQGLIEQIVDQIDLSVQEGFVLRSADVVSSTDFSVLVGKFVRKHHVQTSKHWMHSTLIKNTLY